MSIGLCIIGAEDFKIGKWYSMPKLAAYLRGKIERGEVTQVELERLSNIPDSTLSRIINGGVGEPKASQIAQIAKALDMPFWKLMQIAGFTTDTPGHPSEDVLRIATNLEEQPDLRQMMDAAADLLPGDRDAVLALIADLQRRSDERKTRKRRRKKPQSSGVAE